MSGPRVWYAAYGSNLSGERFDLYRLGGTHPGGTRDYPGFRDRTEPERTVPLTLDGVLYFATESPVWGGGRAFYDPDAPGRTTAARGYLLRGGQFADLLAQEMGRTPGEPLDEEWGPELEGLPPGGWRRKRLGPGRYETVVRTGELDGHPVLTFTAPWGYREVPWRAPSAGYLRELGAGLVQAHGWDAERAARYLAGRPGVGEHWTAAEVAALMG